MNIKLTCKLYDGDARYFIDPILQSRESVRLTLYRNKYPEYWNDKWGEKVIGVHHISKLKFIPRFFNMVFDKHKADVYIGIYEIPHGLLALLAGKLRRKPIIVSIIGNPKYSIRNNGLRGRVTNWIYKKADAITVTGSQSKFFLVERKKLNSEKVFVLPNSLPVEDFLTKDEAIEKIYDLVTLGRLSSEKGLLNLLDIVYTLKKRMPQIKLGIAGEGPQLHELKLRVLELKLENNVDLLGYVDSASVFLNSGKLFITTSFTEGLPRTVIQSMLGGIPVVASNVGDMSDLVINDKTGVLVEDANDNMSFVNGIEMILENIVMYKKNSDNAVKHAKRYYSHNAATKVWNNIFEYLEV
jgi:glycosyltransferase involved in cell wall biosynthesis